MWVGPTRLRILGKISISIATEVAQLGELKSLIQNKTRQNTCTSHNPLHYIHIYMYIYIILCLQLNYRYYVHCIHQHSYMAQLAESIHKYENFAFLSLRQTSCVNWANETLYSGQWVLHQLRHWGSSAGWVQISHTKHGKAKYTYSYMTLYISCSN